MVEVINLVENFPLPDALNDLHAREWALGLDPATNRRLVLHLIQWGRPLGLLPDAPQETHPLIERLENFIGELIEANPATDQRLKGWYSPRERGAKLRRLANSPVDVDYLIRKYIELDSF